MIKILKSKINLIIILQFIYKSLFFSLLITSLAIYSSPKKGECVGDCENGKGKFQYDKSLDEYEGNFQDGKFHGYGVLKIHKGKNKKEKIYDIYEGMFSFDQMEGEGIYKYANGDTITGIFSKNKLNGIGTAKNGFIEKNLGYYYSGMLKDNKFDGFGVYKYPDGSFYIGEFQEGKMSGLGFIKKGNLFKFIDGYDRTGKPEKTLVYKYSSDFYVIQKDTKKQKESLIKKDNFLYGGEIEEDNLNGVGFSIFEKGNIYFGEWSDNIKNGTGIFLQPSGKLYIGNFENNLLNGFGLKFDKDGDLEYSGEWEKGKRKN
jgi:hypothetical protein